MRMVAAALLTSALVALPAQAEPPDVVTDILPVHSLVAAVMDGLGAPKLLIDGSTSPHDFAMRPSQAAALQNADIVIWMGEELTPSIGRAVANLSGDAHALKLLDVDGTTQLEYREGPLFGDHDHDAHAEKEAGHDHDHDKHAEKEAGHDHDHDKHAEKEAGHDHDHDKHAEKEAGHDHDAHAGHDHDGHAHEHDGVDPHAWLDTENAEIWLTAIAEELSEHDPANAATYKANAEKARAMIGAAVSEAAATLSAVKDRPYLVFHDAYHYFEYRFDFHAAGAIAVGDATDPGAARMVELRGFLEKAGAVCVFSEPQHDPASAAALIQGTNASVGVLDPLGHKQEPGPGAYPALIKGMAESLAECLAPQS